MAYRALYRTWRPALFSDVSGQAHIIKVLTGQIESGRIAHAYLFSGPRGTGKTSLAKIFARAVNCTSPKGAEPCDACAICKQTADDASVDIVEIDAASNNGVDSVRELRDRVNLLPAVCRYKVYIIDEVHMLSKGAFNALLKTLEEPPPHVIFILATTEPHKLPPTILSRCQRFDFRRISSQDIAARLAHIAKAESCAFEPEALLAIARAAEGGMRDALSLFEQCTAFGEITTQSVAAALGSGDTQRLQDLIGAICSYDEKGALSALSALLDAGSDTHALIKAMADVIRRMMWLSVGAKAADEQEPYGDYAKRFGKDACIRALNILIRKEYEMRQNLRADIVLETAVLDIMCPEDDNEPKETLRIEKLEARLMALEKQLSQAPACHVTPNAVPPTQAPPKSKPAESSKKTAAKTITGAAECDAQPLWDKLLGVLKKEAYHIYPYAAKTHAVRKSGELLEVVFESDNEMAAAYLQKPAVQAAISQALENISGESVKLRIVALAQQEAKNDHADLLAMFGTNIEKI